MTEEQWQEYDSAASWCARYGLKGLEGDPLPILTSDAVVTQIANDPEAFAERVRGFKYAQAMLARGIQ